jgi:pilus assembly protein Flp/PilA
MGDESMRSALRKISGINRNLHNTPTLISRFVACKSGATAIEYGLICSLIFLVIVTAVRGVAANTQAMHVKIQNATQ